ncbi:uncharacterized protein [Clytia hemisphaerica]|uniref:Potassium channel domain-containing protein n=1 Tax=Clytia hemisphaerica TaxID=252671 RepID=A0A7M5XKM9_9CNID|eukprot:TCONS_00058074-protein
MSANQKKVLFSAILLFMYVNITNSVGENTHWNTTKPQAAPLVEFFYWNVDPFFHVTRNFSKTHGILHESFKKAAIYCNKAITGFELDLNCDPHSMTGSTPKRHFVRYQKTAIGHQPFHAILFDSNRTNLLHYQRPKYHPECSKPVLQMWATIYTDKSKEWFSNHLKDLTMYQLMVSKKVAVIMPRDKIDITYKVLKGIKSCTEPLLLSIIFSLIFGIFLWFCEHRYNEDIDRDFFKGAPDSMWCSFVSMTTVGYGDIYPCTIIGRVSMIIWVTVGLVMIAVMCGTVFDTLGNAPEIYGKRIAVIPNTAVEKFAKSNLNGVIVPGPTYRDLYSKVQEGIADAALVSSDVYVAYQREFRSHDKHDVKLHVVQEFEVDQPVFVATDLRNKTESMDKLYKCLVKENENLIFHIPSVQQPLQVRIDSIDFSNFDRVYLYLFIAILVCFLLCASLHIKNVKMNVKNSINNNKPIPLKEVLERNWKLDKN